VRCGGLDKCVEWAETDMDFIFSIYPAECIYGNRPDLFAFGGFRCVCCSGVVDKLKKMRAGQRLGVEL